MTDGFNDLMKSIDDVESSFKGYGGHTSMPSTDEGVPLSMNQFGGYVEDTQDMPGKEGPVYVTDTAGDKPGKLMTPADAAELQSGQSGDDFSYSPTGPANQAPPGRPMNHSTFGGYVEDTQDGPGQEGPVFVMDAAGDTPGEYMTAGDAADLAEGQSGDDYMYVPTGNIPVGNG